jgi:hypothetical protein
VIGSRTILLGWPGDKARGGDGSLRDTAISLTRGRTLVTLHCDYSDNVRMLSAGFILPEPLPSDEEINGVIDGTWQRCANGFLLRLHEWLEGKRPPPKLFEPDPPVATSALTLATQPGR